MSKNRITAAQARQQQAHPKALTDVVADLFAAIERNANSGTPHWPVELNPKLSYELSQRAAAAIRSDGFICEVISWSNNKAQIWVTMEGESLDERTAELGRELRQSEGDQSDYGSDQALRTQVDALLEIDPGLLAMSLEMLTLEEMKVRLKALETHVAGLNENIKRTRAAIANYKPPARPLHEFDPEDESSVRFSLMEIDPVAAERKPRRS